MATVWSVPCGRPHVAVVEDDDDLRENILVPELSEAGFEVTGVNNALGLYRSMTSRRYDLVILDLSLPDEDGLAIAQHLRTLSSSLGIVVLTGRISRHDHVRALDAGADAYLAKPADLEKLAATLRNLARRVRPALAQDGTPGKWRLTGNGWRIVSPGNAEVGMTLAEREVMRLLAASPGLPVARDDLIACLAENIHDFDPHRLEMLVYRLRKRCQQVTGEALPIRTVRGVGYVLAW